MIEFKSDEWGRRRKIIAMENAQDKFLESFKTSAFFCGMTKHKFCVASRIKKIAL